MKLCELFSEELLEKMIQDGYVTKRWHPVLPIYILNYASSAQFDNMWNEVTMQCRGLIADKEGNVVARPFRKFFNLNTSYRAETHEANLPKEKPEVYDKADGSLGILWRYDGWVGIATRGSFESEQAKWATNILWNHYNAFATWYRDWKTTFPFTYLFEIIYDENRIVVEYPFQDLVLLSVVYENGNEMDRDAVENCSWPGRIVEKYSKDLTQCLEDQTKNREGYVLFYRKAGLRVKVKFEEYMRLHKLLTGVTPKVIWQELGVAIQTGNNERIQLWMKNTPQSFQEWITQWNQRLTGEYDDIMSRAQELHDSVTSIRRERSQIAEEFKKHPKLAPVAFALLDGQQVKAHTIAWKLVKPKVSTEDVYRKDTDS